MGVRLASVVVVSVALSLFGCNEKPSKLDGEFAKRASGDPWAATFTKKDDGSGDGGGFGGFDLQSMLERIKESIETPGPYESPKKSKDFDEEKPHWGVMPVSGDIVEREAFSLTGGGRGTELRNLAMRLRTLAKDDKLQGLILRVDDLDISMPDLVELRDAMQDFRNAKKQLRCHAESASNATYLVLAACDKIGLAPLGDIAITGPAAMPIHVKPLLDKLAITADFIHVGAYKGAAEPLTRDAPSKEMEETLGAILDRRYQSMVDDIAASRHLDPATVKTLIDTALFPAPEALFAKLVDDVSAWETFRDEVKAPWTKLEIEPDDKDQLQSMVKVARFLGAMPPDRPLGDHVAIVYALGDIKDGDGDGVLGARQEIASHTLVSALRALAADDAVKAVVLRIDSGGGSAQASELIWSSIEQLKAKKPVIVSMSDVAASGGYYIASGATKIFAQANTLTGSIGVVGGHIAPGAALAKLGVNTFPMGRGKHATMMASFKPWTDDERALMQHHMEAVYNTFVARVAAGRKKTVEQILPIAQGRVWTGTKALELGLVDEIGGLDAAVAEARKLAKVDAEIALEVYPPSPTLRDLLAGWGQVHAPLGVSAEASAIEALRALDPHVALAAERLLALVMSFRTTTIQTVAILPEVH
ncbi:MAG TPA: signal peptide peptidase SppA [Kofleriaceae bacterium]|nr:signal peptide peptidase SppA [Kofleriaceae bacterium]